jgi:hypothetical protein
MFKNDVENRQNGVSTPGDFGQEAEKKQRHINW